ncbi:MAG: GAF domain-containing protein [Pyrinomonadaceae bacterium]
MISPKGSAARLICQELLNLVMDTLGSLTPYDAAGIYLIESATSELPQARSGCKLRTEVVRGYDIEELQNLSLKVGEARRSDTLAQTGEPIRSADVRHDPRYINARRETRSELVAPIISNNEVIGVVDLESDRLDAYTEDDLQMLLLLASQVAIIIEKVMLHEQLVEKKRLQGQLEVARQVQLELLPARHPNLKGFDISAYNFPSEEVSGDYYDFVRIFEDQLGIVVADVSGKRRSGGIASGCLRASLRAAIHIGYASNISMAKVNYLCGSL